MKLEVGMYIRDKNKGEIYKINEFHLKFRSKKTTYDFEKASHNIIDLIEVGDYVNGIRIDNLCSNRFTNAKAVVSNLLENDINRKCYYFENKDIKTILTKEQFENNCYKIDKEMNKYVKN